MTPTEPDYECIWAWLHVSDIHLRQEPPTWVEDQALVLEGLLADLPDAIASGAPAPAAILCTGDVGATGAVIHAEEYDQALEWLGRLEGISGADSFFCVPGNHDVQRTRQELRAPMRLLEYLREGREALDSAYEHPPDRDLLVARFARYCDFAKRAGSPVASDAVSTWCVEQEHGTHRIRLLGLNTAVLCNDDHDETKLRAGIQQLKQAFARPPDGAMTIVLAHHPTSWMEPSERNALDAYLLNQADVFLHGHIHEAASERRVAGDGREVVTITAGAVHGDEGADRRHGYSIAGLFQGPTGKLVVRVWPRSWVERDRRFVIDERNVGQAHCYAEHPLPERLTAPHLTPPPQTALGSVADRLISRLGSRRTAFPTDMSIAELHQRDLTIPARVSTAAGFEAGPDALVARLRARSSVLVLGSPGSGKTVLVHEAALALLKEGIVPLVVDLAELPTIPTSMEKLVELVAGGPVPIANNQLVLLADGLDEQLAGGAPVVEIAERLRAVVGLGPTLVACRQQDYEQRLAAVVNTSLFDTVTRIQPWRVTVEFADFVTRLVAAELLADSSIVERVESSDELKGLTERPLFARMLTFLAQGFAEHVLPADATALYQGYLGKLGVAATAGLQQMGCQSVVDAAHLWREAAWYVHWSRLQADAVPIDALLGLFRAREIEADCTYRALSSILDLRADPTSTTAGFVHYSFYEFLVAQYAAEGLTRAQDLDDPGLAASLLAVDLPQEIRRHLTNLLRRTTLDIHAWPRWLTRVYGAAQGSIEQERTIRNLVAYLTSRLDVPATPELRSLLQDEDDPFLRNSLMWALVRLDDRDALVQYLQELQDETLASLNRGYLLYYFGDLERGNPPYEDRVPFVAWDHTRARLLSRYGDDEAYEGTVPARRVIDLYTLCDFAVVRQERLLPQECEVVARLRRELDEMGLDSAVLEQLDDHLHAVGAEGGT